MNMEFSAIVTKEDKWFVALCPELDIASQGKTQDKALKNLKEAIELYLEDEDARIPLKVVDPILTFVRVELNETPRSIRV